MINLQMFKIHSRLRGTVGRVRTAHQIVTPYSVLHGSWRAGDAGRGVVRGAHPTVLLISVLLLILLLSPSLVLAHV